MQSSPSNPYPSIDPVLGVTPAIRESELMATASHSPHSDAFVFEGRYEGQMEMSANRETVARYLDVHKEWFHRCAHPMAVEAIGQNGYALVIGHFGALGYEIEPKIGLHLLPQERGVYQIETIPVPNYESSGYDVDFRAALELTEHANENAPQGISTQVEWELNLNVAIQFPRFIHALPQPLVKASGDRLLNQVVRQVSKRLTRKVQDDFHRVKNLPLPSSYNRHRFWATWAKLENSQ